MASAAFAQTAATETQSQPAAPAPVPTLAPPLQLSPAEQTFRQEQAAMGEQFAELIRQGATGSQIIAWQQSVAARQTAQLQRAQALAALRGNMIPLISDATIPGGASPQLQSLIVNQIDLANASIELNNQVAAAQGNQTVPAVPSDEQLATLRQATASLRQNQSQLASNLADQTVNSAMPVPDAPRLPNTMPAPLRAFLLLRYQLLKERAQLWNQNLSADPATRLALILQWEQQNATRISQLQQEAQSISAPQN
jgi:hypothetical protein